VTCFYISIATNQRGDELLKSLNFNVDKVLKNKVTFETWFYNELSKSIFFILQKKISASLYVVVSFCFENIYKNLH